MFEITLAAESRRLHRFTHITMHNIEMPLESAQLSSLKNSIQFCLSIAHLSQTSHVLADPLVDDSVESFESLETLRAVERD